jgi:hypothetical protein
LGSSRKARHRPARRSSAGSATFASWGRPRIDIFLPNRPICGSVFQKPRARMDRKETSPARSNRIVLQPVGIDIQPIENPTFAEGEGIWILLRRTWILLRRTWISLRRAWILVSPAWILVSPAWKPMGALWCARRLPAMRGRRSASSPEAPDYARPQRGNRRGEERDDGSPFYFGASR